MRFSKASAILRMEQTQCVRFDCGSEAAPTMQAIASAKDGSSRTTWKGSSAFIGMAVSWIEEDRG